MGGRSTHKLRTPHRRVRYGRREGKRTRNDVHARYAERALSVRRNRNLFPPSGWVTAESLFSRAGYRIFHGDGTGTTIVTESINGVIHAADIHGDLTYTINTDCTGTVKVVRAGATQEIFVAPNGDDMTVIATDNGHVEAFSSWRVGSE